jgi:hypothetical protein
LIGLCTQTIEYVRFILFNAKGFQMLVSDAKNGGRVRVGVRNDYLVASAPDQWIEGHLFRFDTTEKTKWNEHFIAWEKVPEALQRYYSHDSISPADRQKYRIPNRFRFGHNISEGANVILLPPDKISSTGFFLTAIGLGAALSALSTNQNLKEIQATRALESQ